MTTIAEEDRPLFLDLYCCQGGSSQGYADAGFKVVGVDKDPQPRYPFEFHQGDAIEYLLKHWRRFAAVGGSPPCQGYSKTWKLRKRQHPKLIAETREAFIATGLPYVIENVEEAEDELINPVELCGTMFGIKQYRHRLFEANWQIIVPAHPEHIWKQTKMGRPPKPDEFMQVVGNFSGVARAREDMQMPWANRDGLREAVPPAYTRFIGGQLMQVVAAAREGVLV